jgi:hypothetical protein
VDGLHAPVGDPAGLAAVLRRAAEEPGLWNRLAANVRRPPDMDDAARAHLDLYADALRRKRGRRAAPPDAKIRRPPVGNRARPAAATPS